MPSSYKQVTIVNLQLGKMIIFRGKRQKGIKIKRQKDKKGKRREKTRENASFFLRSP